MKQEVKWSDPGCKGQQDAIRTQGYAVSLVLKQVHDKFVQILHGKISKAMSLCQMFSVFNSYGRHSLRV